MKPLKQLNPDGPGAAGGSVVEEPVKGINIAVLNGFKGDEAVTPVEPVKAVEKTEEVKTPEQGGSEAKTEGEGTEQKKGEEAKTTPGESSKSGEAISTFKFKGEEKVGDEEFSWSALAKRLTDSDIKADTFEDFSKTFDDFKEKLKSEARGESFTEMLAKEPAQVQEAFLLAKNGVSLEEISKPAHEAEYLLSLSNYDLVKWNLSNKGFDPEAIDMKMEKMAESGDVDKEAGPIRKSVEDFKQSVLKERTEFIENLRAQEQNRHIQEKQKVASGLMEALKKTPDYLGTPLNDMLRDGIVKRFNEGRYDDLRNSPQALMQAILSTEFGEQAMMSLKQRERAAAIEAHTKGLHNTPPVEKGMNTVSKQGNQGKQDNWAALGDFTKNK